MFGWVPWSAKEGQANGCRLWLHIILLIDWLVTLIAYSISLSFLETETIIAIICSFIYSFIHSFIHLKKDRSFSPFTMTTPQLHRDRALVLSSMYGEGDHPSVRKKWSTTGNNKSNSIPTGDPPIKPSEVDEDCSETSILSYGDEEDVSSSSSSLHVYEIKEVPAAATLLPGKERTKSLAQLYNTSPNNKNHFVSDGAMRSKSTVHLSPPSRRVWKTSGRTAHVGTPVNRKKETSPIPSHDFSRRPLKPSEIARQERSKSSSLSSLRNFSNPSVASIAFHH